MIVRLWWQISFVFWTYWLVRDHVNDASLLTIGVDCLMMFGSFVAATPKDNRNA